MMPHQTFTEHDSEQDSMISYFLWFIMFFPDTVWYIRSVLATSISNMIYLRLSSANIGIPPLSVLGELL